MVVFYAVSSLMAILTAWYFYCYFRRVLNFFSVPDGKMKKAVLILCALIFGLCAADTMGIGFLAVMHVMIIGFFMQFTDFTLKKIQFRCLYR